MKAQTVGVIGGGQLARMMIPPAINLGLNISVLAEAEGMSAQLAATQVGDYRDPETVYAFAKTVDVVTFDHEHVPSEILTELVRRGHEVHPGPRALQFAQDKLLMRQKLSELGLPVPAWAAVRTAEELSAFLAEHGPKAVLKTARGGYDGKGVRVIEHAEEAADWFTALAEDGRGGALLVEAFVPFRRELAQLVARSPQGECVSWPLVETKQRDGVCAEVYAPAAEGAESVGAGSAGGASLSERAGEIARSLAEAIGVTGVMAVELFETADGELSINELAMRPHNSGHWSIEGAITSQFEQHLRAVANLPLGSAALRAPHTVMINVLGGPSEGTMQSAYPTALAEYPEAKVHSYAKTSRPGRKVGHVTVTGDNAETVLQRARGAAALFDS